MCKLRSFFLRGLCIERPGAGGSRLWEDLVPHHPEGGCREWLAVEDDLLDLATGLVLALEVGPDVHRANPSVGRADDQHHRVFPLPPVCGMTSARKPEDFLPVFAGLKIRIPG